MSAVHRPFFIETTTFPDKDSVKTLSSVCNADFPALTKIENISDIMDNTHGVLNVKFRLYISKYQIL